MLRTLTALCAILLFAGCGGNSGNDQEAAHEAANEATQESAALVAPASYDGEAVTLEGSLGCGHCTHHIGTSCSAALETADGTVYILDGMKEGDAPFDQRFDGLTLKVVGQTAMNGDTHFVKVESFEEI